MERLEIMRKCKNEEFLRVYFIPLLPFLSNSEKQLKEKIKL